MAAIGPFAFSFTNTRIFSTSVGDIIVRFSVTLVGATRAGCDFGYNGLRWRYPKVESGEVGAVIFTGLTF